MPLGLSLFPWFVVFISRNFAAVFFLSDRILRKRGVRPGPGAAAHGYRGPANRGMGARPSWDRRRRCRGGARGATG